MARFRKVKNKKFTKQKDSTQAVSVKGLLFLRFKAFITDMFMIMMPILYIITYIILDGKDTFLSSNPARLSGALLYGVIVIVFWYKAAQTPGMRAYEIKIKRLDDTKITITQALGRYLLFIVSASTLLLLLVPFFRKDRQMFHDILSRTKIVKLKD